MAKQSKLTYDEYPFIGSAEGQNIYQLRVEHFVGKLNPPPVLKLRPIDPSDYFVTSGDAIQKTLQLSRDLKVHHKRVKAVYKKNKTIKPYYNKILEAGEGVRKMLKSLQKAKGPAIFLETEWESGILRIIPKNPRIREEV